MTSMTNMHQGASSSSSLHPQNYRYDVFLSFRGEDTRSNFTGHLYNALHHKGIDTFMDDNLPRGEDISSELVKAIEESRVSLIIFSENYASSRWCLDELIKIIQCRESKGQMVRPIFYKVDPSDVRNQSGTFGEAFATLECKFKLYMDKWKVALSEAATLSGWPFMDGHESQFVNKIVEELYIQVSNHSYSLDMGPCPVGLEHSVEDIGQLLNFGDNTVRMVGIWGPGGIGKTTIAKAVHNSMAHRFDGRCFLTNIPEKSKTKEGLVQLQETLLSSILGQKEFKVINVDNGVNVIRKRLSHKRVLLILDDVNELEQLYYLARGCDWFGFGSRIIITTRDKHLLTAHQVHSIYEVNMLADDGALELFSWNAFKTKGPPDDFSEITRCVLHYAQGLPLALIVVGCHLFGRSIEQWEAALDSYKKVPHKKTHDILKISFDVLEDPLKEFFLDVACFFNGANADYATQVLEACCDINPVIGITLLQEKALIRIDGGKIWMHDLIEEMGKEIVRQESPDEPGNRSRLWIEDDVEYALTNNTGTNNIKGIHESLWTSNEISLNAKSFSEMKRLRYLSLISNHQGSFLDIDYLSNELRWLRWFGCPLQFFPSNFHPKKVVGLYIPNSGIKQLWAGYKNLQSLTSMSLSSSEFLTKIPDLSGAPNLEMLNIDDCESLVEVHESVGCLDKLVTLSLAGCYNLTVFPTRISLKSLETLYLRDCERLENFPEIVGKMDFLRIMNLGGTAITEVHSSIGYLIGLEELCLCSCKNLTKLPCSILELQILEILDLDGCQKLVRFPNKSASQVSSSAKPLIPNCSLDSQGSLVLPNLKEFRIGGCNLSDGDFLMTPDCSETLTKLDMSGSHFVSLPACISKFVNLEKIDLHNCKRLREIPELGKNVNWLDVSDCELLKQYSKLSKVLEHDESQGLYWMKLWNCRRLCDNPDSSMAKMDSTFPHQDGSGDVIAVNDAYYNHQQEQVHGLLLLLESDMQRHVKAIENYQDERRLFWSPEPILLNPLRRYRFEEVQILMRSEAVGEQVHHTDCLQSYPPYTQNSDSVHVPLTALPYTHSSPIPKFQLHDIEILKAFHQLLTS